MKFTALAFLLLALSGMAKEYSFNDRRFQVADGYTLEVAVPAALVERPIEADFDAKGRLYVSESSGSNEPAEQQLEKKPHRLLQLTDTNHDGIYDEKSVFADGLMFPEGVLCHEGSVYVAAPPQIWKFTDADDDGVAEKREIWYDGKTLTGCANDLHGPYLGPDGLIYWCKGAFAEQTHDLPAKPQWTSRASHVFRMKPDGTQFDCVFTAGMDNPVGVAWTPEGDLMVSGTFLQQPADGKRDGIIHAVLGGVWGKEHDVLEGHPRTGDLLPPMTHLGPAAAAGMCRYGRDLLVAQFNLHKVSRHKLIPQGASYRTEDSDLLVSDHPDFHPTDVLQAPDGSILVVDTGGWYKLCCPTSQLAKPNVPGAIYRLRKTGGEIPPNCPPPSWKLAQPSEFASLVEQSQSPQLHVRRAAIEELGARMATKAGTDDSEKIVSALARAAKLPNTDRFLEHALIFALMECRDHKSLHALALQEHAGLQRMAIIAISQCGPDEITPAELGQLLAHPEASVRQAVFFGLRRNKSWRGAVTTWLAQHLLAQPDTMFVTLINEYATEMPDLLPDLGSLLRQSKASTTRQNLLNAMRLKIGQNPWPSEWTPLLRDALNSPDAVEVRAAADCVAAAKFNAEDHACESLRAASMNVSQPAMIRLLLLSNPTLASGTADQADFCIRQLNEPKDLETRLLAAQTLGKWKLPEATLSLLASKIGTLGVLERSLLLKIFLPGGSEQLGMTVVTELEKLGILPTISEALVNECFANFPDPVKSRLAKSRNAAKPGGAAQQKQLAELATAMPKGDAQRGSIVFSSNKASCTLCHQIGYKGGRLGPDLTKVGSIRTPRDLLESIVLPSASFVRSYEPVMIQKTDGSSVYGIIRNQGKNQLTLTTGVATPEVTIVLTAVKSITPGEFSLMPAGLDQVLSRDELADLVAYLMSLK